MKPANQTLSNLGTTVFTVMSALANQHGAINLGQGFPDTDGPDDVIQAAADALRDGRNQYPPLTGVPELRAAVAAANQRFYGITVDPATEVVVNRDAISPGSALFDLVKAVSASTETGACTEIEDSLGAPTAETPAPSETPAP